MVRFLAPNAEGRERGRGRSDRSAKLAFMGEGGAYISES
jgi:hypothetical protein